MVWPPGVIGLLVTEAVRGEGGILRNASGERFMERYDPKRLELSTRDVVARAIHTEVKGSGERRTAACSSTSRTCRPRLCGSKLPSMYDQFMELAGLDITREPMEVGPTCHYFIGGVRTDAETGASTVPGLFATGECSGGMKPPTGWAATPCLTCWCSESALARVRRDTPPMRPRRRSTTPSPRTPLPK